MKITVSENRELFYREAASRIAAVIRKKPDARLGLSTGRTTKGVHAALVELWREEGFDCSGLTVFGIDEITGMGRECPASCYYILLHDVMEPLGIPAEQFLMPDPMAEDLEAECRRFEERVEEKGGPDFIFLGLGENGHLGFNQPGTPFGQRTWLSWMDESLTGRLRREYGIPEENGMGGLTLGIKNLMQCAHLVMAANGKEKAETVRKMTEGPVTEQVPASILQLHPNCELILDPEAVGGIRTIQKGR